MPVPTTYGRVPETSLANYDWVDIQEGTGIVHYKGCRVHVDSVAANDEYIFTTNSAMVTSESTYLKYTLLVNATDIDFDINFNFPKIIKGTAFFVLPIYFNGNSTVTPAISVIHYDGTTETVVVAATSTVQASNAAGAAYRDRNLKLTIPTTKFAAGDTLRINVTASHGGAGSGYLVHEPSGWATFTGTSGGVFSAFIPFKIDLSQ